ncbi:O-antigen ligase family protein [Candidatus Thioglobus sp.]|nr:O-antigen ligase family protein [Candidatus Thioglobus sp.]
MLSKTHLTKVYQYLLIILAFVFPLSVVAGNLIIALILLVWFSSGDFTTKLMDIKQSKILVASIIFFLLHVVGLLWTDNLLWGLTIVKKMWYFLLLLPILYTIVRKEYINYYINSFLIAIFISVVLSFLVWFQIMEPFKNATLLNPTPFMSHISYNPILAFAIYIVGHKILFKNDLNKLWLITYSLFFFIMSINMFITAGRAGQLAYFLLIGILIFQYFTIQRVKAFFAILLIIPTIFISAYYASDLFHDRIHITINEVSSFHKNTSIGRRMSFAINTFELIKKDPLLGVGTGDFPKEYLRINEKRIHFLLINERPTNPHNMYLLILAQLGLIGLISMLSIFYYQFKFSFNVSNKLRSDIGFALPSMFILIMISDSYLLGHYTTLLFVFFSSFVYNDFKKFA